MDVDEALLREGAVSARLYGYLSVPAERRLLQGAKVRSLAGEVATQAEIAHHLVDRVLGDATWFVGPGTTTGRILDALGLRGTTLGVDAVLDGELLAPDLDEDGILRLLDAYPQATLVLGVIGGQGFLLGRGNQQVSAEVLRRVGSDNLVIVAGADKVSALDPPVLHVDLGDDERENLLEGYRRVRVAPDRTMVLRVSGG